MLVESIVRKTLGLKNIASKRLLNSGGLTLSFIVKNLGNLKGVLA